MSKKQAHEIGIPSVCPWTAGACRDSADRVEKCRKKTLHTRVSRSCLCPWLLGAFFPLISMTTTLCVNVTLINVSHFCLVLWAFRLLGLGSFEFAASHQKCPWAQGERKKSLNRLQIVSYYYNLLLLLLFSLIMSKKRAHEIGIPSVCPWTAGACRDSADRVEKCQIYPPHTGVMCMHVPLIAGRLFPAHIHDDDILCQSDLDSCFPHFCLVLWAFRLLGLGSFEFAASHQKCPWAQGERKKSLNRLQIVSYYYNLLLLLLFSLIMSKKQAHEIGIPSVCPWTAGACRDSADRVEKCQIYPPHTGVMCMHVPLIAGRLFPAHIHDDDILCQSDLDSCFSHFFLVLLGVSAFGFRELWVRCKSPEVPLSTGWAEEIAKSSSNSILLL